MYLIDTNVVSELTRRAPDPSVVAWFGGLPELALSAVTIEELVYGIERLPPERAGKLRRWLQKLLAIPPEVVPISHEIARTAGQLRAAQERRGRTAAQADMLIAATALQTGRVLSTRNTKDFEGCGVPLFNPFSSAAGPVPRPRR
jgi:predicted nucleic acid-binding protein